MSGELKPIQSSQSTSSALTIPVTCEFLELPREVIMLAILQRICKPEDVANLNLVSKFIRELNQDSNIVDSRIQALFDKYFLGKVLDNCDWTKYTYQNYTGINSFFRLYKKISDHELNQLWRFGYPIPNLTKQCYDALPADLQTDLRWHIWNANQRDDEGHGIFFGEHIINNYIDDTIVRTATKNCILTGFGLKFLRDLS